MNPVIKQAHVVDDDDEYLVKTKVMYYLYVSYIKAISFHITPAPITQEFFIALLPEAGYVLLTASAWRLAQHICTGNLIPTTQFCTDLSLASIVSCV